MEQYLKMKSIDVSIAEGSRTDPASRTGARVQTSGLQNSPESMRSSSSARVSSTRLASPLLPGRGSIALDPLAGVAQEVSGDALRRRRFAVMEKARGAKSFGVIVSTKSGQQRMELARQLVKLSPHAVIVTMREVNPDELLNLGFACYVNTACPRLAYDDQVRFPVPVLSPQEFEIIRGVRTWDEYTIDEI